MKIDQTRKKIDEIRQEIEFIKRSWIKKQKTNVKFVEQRAKQMNELNELRLRKCPNKLRIKETYLLY